MAQEKPNRLFEWIELFRKQVPVVRQHLFDWWEAVRDEPALIWRTTAVRYAFYGFALMVLLFAASSLSKSMAPPPPASAKRTATKADFHVVCTNDSCNHHFAVRRKFGFSRFPVHCPKCQENTGNKASRCNSSSCRGRWVAPEAVDGLLRCPRCGEPMN